MRWESLMADHVEVGGTLPLFQDETVVRRFNTPEFKGITFYEVKAKSIINHVKGNRLGFNWTINPYRGCSHACAYCFARPTHTYLDFNAGHDFESKIVVKINAVELLRRELQRPTWRGEHIAMGTNTDNYQRAEGRYRLMPGILAELNKAGNPYSILTKSTLIQRDIDLLAEGASISSVSACFSVGTVDEEVWKRTEPGTPHPLKRLEVVHKLNDSGVPCGVMVAPILPGISDSMEQMEATVRAAVEAGATNIVPIVLHLRPGVKEEFMGWLKESHPELVTTYEQMYRGAYAPKEVSEPITKAVRHLKKRHGAKEPSGPARPLARGGSGSRRKPKAEPSETESHEQMTLDLGKQSKRAPKWVKEKVTA
jgi:DNA repair photolyase